MTARTNLTHKLTSLILCAVMILTYIPATYLTANAAGVFGEGAVSKTADAETLNAWELFFPSSGTLTTENAGGVWTDKSVLTGPSPALPGIDLDDPNAFLVALSAMASNMTITGMSNVPTDTMLILDVSGSMNESNNDVASKLADAANAAIAALLDSNKYARVGVVLYSASATLTLPLGRYTTSDSRGRFLNYTDDFWNGEVISLNSSVYYEGTTRRPSSSSKSVSGATYIQSGLNLAKNQFVAEGNETTVTEAGLGTVKRKPVVVLLSDGAPTLATTNFKSPGSTNLGDRENSNAAVGFTTQLTAAYLKNQIEAKYQNDSLFYTLGIGITPTMSDYEIAEYVLSPNEKTITTAATSIRNLWTQYNSAAVNDRITVRGSYQVTKSSEALEQYYVDKYYDTAAYGSNLGDGLTEAFGAIVDEIKIQSKYFPTLTQSAGEHLSGYVTFRDKIGKYMNVTDIKGLMIHDSLFSGADLASNFVAGGGLLGTVEEPTKLGDELANSVMVRLGLKDLDEARTLIGLAYQYGQFRYNSTTDFSNYIGWYANKDGKFLGFYQEGVTILPDPADPTLTDETRPFYIVRSYGYLGEVDETHGVSKSDMMYATVRVMTEIQNGEQTVEFAVPAALIPTITYDVTLNEKEELKDITVSGATAPIRLVYEVALKDEINEFTVNDIVDPTYITSNLNADGSVNFYTNQYEVDNSTGFDAVTGEMKVNTYAYFRPSRQNNRYYYQTDTLVYTDDQGTLYRGDESPTGTMYHEYTVYTKTGTTVEEKTVYHRLTAESIGTSYKTESDNTWNVKAGTVRRDYAGYMQLKSPNESGTLTFIAAPFQDIQGYSVDDTTHSFVVGATMGNNGKLTLKRESGIKLTKALAEGATPTDAHFSFILTNLTNISDNSSYPAYIEKLDGTKEIRTVKFTSGISNVVLKAGEVLYIGGMSSGDIVNVWERETLEYVAQSVNGAASNSADITISNNVFNPAAFVNADRGTGNLTVSKEVTHPFGGAYTIPEKTFEFTVTLTLGNTALVNYTLSTSKGNMQTDVDGKVTFEIVHGEQIEFFGLPEGTAATVVETTPGEGFKEEYWDNGQPGDGIVDIEKDRTVSVIVVNDYTPDPVFPVNIELTGTKTVTGRTPDAWIEADVYTFVLEQYNFTTQLWENVGTGEERTVDMTTPGGAFSFSDVFAGEDFKFNTAGIYHYRVREVLGSVEGITYDTALHSFAVNVADLDMDGKLEITSVTPTDPTVTGMTFENGTYKLTADFTNKYTPGETTATVTVNKKANNPSGSSQATQDGFTFEVYEYDLATGIGAKIGNASSPTAVSGTTRIVLPTFTSVGTYRYAVKEVKGSKIGWTYSEEIKYVTVVVTDNGTDLVAAAYEDNAEGTVIPSNDAASNAKIEFTNTYTPKATEFTVDFVTKRLIGRELNAGEFTFFIKANGHIMTDKYGNSIEVIKGTNGADGKVTFESPIYFTGVGIYFFDITEEAKNTNGITSDKNTYRLTITVADINGELTASYEIANAAGDTVEFVNTYTTAPVSNTVSGAKELTGRVLMNDEFRFSITQVADQNGTALPGASTFYTTNRIDGTFSFAANVYTAPGTYYYEVAEEGPADGSPTYGIKFDETKYIVTVKVVDDLNGKLVVESVDYSVNDRLVFKNVYTATPANAVISGKKILSGRALEEGEFTFKLLNQAGTVLESVKNGADGSFKFKALEFDTAGTYYFTVIEEEGSLGGVTYDTTEYQVVVDVVDNLRGALYTSILLLDENSTPRASVTFENVYAVTGDKTLVLTGSKILNGRPILNGEFIFDLYKTESDFVIAGEAEEYLSTTNDVNGDFEFLLQLNPEDVGNTYYFVARERNFGETINGVTYSTEVYNITVKVMDDGNGGIATETTITNNGSEAEVLSFENIYAEDVTVDVNIDKTVENIGGESITPEGFGFNLKGEGTDTTVKTDANGDAEITLTFSEADIGKTFTYKVTEIDDRRAYVTYSTVEYTVTVKVVLAQGNALAAEVFVDGVKVDEATLAFVNEYDYTVAPSDISIGLEIGKTVENKGGESITPEGFSFSLKGEGKDLTAKTDAEGFGEFTLDYTAADIGKTFTYKVTEINDGREYVTYSTAEYTVTVKITHNTENNTLVADVQVNGEAVNSVLLEFVNEYDYTIPPPEDITVDVSVDKTVENKGEDTITPEGFSFNLKGEGKDLTVKTDADGNAVFTVTYTAADIGKTFTYKVTEINDGRAYVTYSTVEYTVTVTLSLTDDNTLAAVVAVDGEAVEAAALEFVNEYDYTAPPMGDNAYGWFAVLTVSIGGIVGVTVLKKKKDEEEAFEA